MAFQETLLEQALDVLRSVILAASPLSRIGFRKHKELGLGKDVEMKGSTDNRAIETKLRSRMHTTSLVEKHVAEQMGKDKRH